MTIEQEFFEAFGIEPKRRFFQCKNGIDYYEDCELVCNECSEAIYQEKYPPITPEIMLNLQVILCNFHSEHECCLLITGNSIENITINILKDCIELKDYIQSEVLTLFSK